MGKKERRKHGFSSKDEDFFITDELAPYFEIASQFKPKDEERREAFSKEQMLHSLEILQSFDRKCELEPGEGLERFTPTYLYRYDEFLKYVKKLDGKGSKFYHESFKNVLQLLKKLRSIDKNPYNYLECFAPTCQNAYPISLHEIELIEEAEFDKELESVKTMFLTMAYSGCNFKSLPILDVKMFDFDRFDDSKTDCSFHYNNKNTDPDVFNTNVIVNFLKLKGGNVLHNNAIYFNAKLSQIQTALNFERDLTIQVAYNTFKVKSYRNQAEICDIRFSL